MTNPLQEDKGLVEIHRVCVEMNGIWRPTPCHDLGIDGQIELLESGTSISTGHIIAVQSKSGPSFFINQDGDSIKFYPKDKHRTYWQRLKLPVVLVLHNPNDGLTIYTQVKPQLSQSGPIMVQKNDLFQPSCRGELIYLSEEEGLEPSPAEILDKLKNIKLYVSGDSIITGIDFLLACINRTGGYFEIRMARIMALYDLASRDDGYYVGSETYDYIHRNIMTIHSKKLVEDFLDEFENMWYDEQIVPDILSPLTFKGEHLIDFLWGNLGQYLTCETYSQFGITDPTKLAELISGYSQKFSNRFDASYRMSLESR